MKPVLSVIMLVYNSEKYLREAIKSVLQQTYENFELILVNDGSTDASSDIIASFDDKRIRHIELEKNKGIANGRNIGLKEARGEFLCWFDSDDICPKQRFYTQIKFLQNNIDYGGCGTWLSRFKNDQVSNISKAAADSETIKTLLLFKAAAVPNATVMLRLSEIRKHDLWYNTALPIAEDYDFIFRCSQYLKFYNIQEVLYNYRASETSIMKEYEDLYDEKTKAHNTIYTNVLSNIGLTVTKDTLKLHYLTCSEQIFTTRDEFVSCYNWLTELRSANSNSKIYDELVLEKILGEQFFFISKKATKFGWSTLYFFFKKSTINNWSQSFNNFSKLGLRCLVKHDKFEF